MSPLKPAMVSLLRPILTYFRYPLSSLQAQQYATKAYSPVEYHWTAARLLYHLYLFTLCLRLTLLSVFDQLYTPHDWAIALMRQYISHHLLGIALVPFILTFSYFDLKLVIRPVASVAKLIVELIIANKLQLPSKQAKMTFLAHLVKGKAVHVQYHQQSLSHYRSFSATTRFKLATANEIIEYIYRFAIPLVRLAAIIFFLFFATNRWHPFEHPCQLLVAVVDATLLLMALNRHVWTAMAFGQHCFFVVTLAVYWHAVEVTKVLLKQYGSVDRSKLMVLLSTYRRQHSLVLTDLIAFNRHLASGLLFAMVASNLVFNIYFVSVLWFIRLDHLLRQYMLAGVFSQAIAVPLLLVHLPEIVKVLYGTGKALYRAQSRLVGCTREKIKLLYYYELINTDEPFCYTLGCGISIVRQWLPEFVLFYSVYMMFCFQLFINRHLEKIQQ